VKNNFYAVPEIDSAGLISNSLSKDLREVLLSEVLKNKKRWYFLGTTFKIVINYFPS